VFLSLHLLDFATDVLAVMGYTPTPESEAQKDKLE